MKKILAVLLLLTATPLMAEEEECLYDQDEQRARHLELQKKYPGSRYLEDEYKLIIPRDGAEISLSRGGCVHFGISIELRMPKTDDFKSEAAFFEKVVELVEEFGRELIDPEKLRKNMKEKKWSNLSDEGGLYYFIGYEGVTAFEAYQRDEDGKTLLGVSFYI